MNKRYSFFFVLVGLAVIIGLLVLLTGIKNTESADGGLITKKILISEIRTENIDKVSKTLEEVNSMKYQGQILPFLNDLWEQRTEKHPDLPWPVISTDIIRVHIANILLQAHINKQFDSDWSNLRKFVLDRIDNNDRSVAMQSIQTALYIDDDQAVKRVLEVAKKRESQILFRLSVVILAQMCSPSAEDALVELERTLKDEESRSFVINEKDGANASKGKAFYCDYKMQKN